MLIRDRGRYGLRVTFTSGRHRRGWLENHLPCAHDESPVSASSVRTSSRHWNPSRPRRCGQVHTPSGATILMTLPWGQPKVCDGGGSPPHDAAVIRLWFVFWNTPYAWPGESGDIRGDTKQLWSDYLGMIESPLSASGPSNRAAVAVSPRLSASTPCSNCPAATVPARPVTRARATIAILKPDITARTPLRSASIPSNSHARSCRR